MSALSRKTSKTPKIPAQNGFVRRSAASENVKCCVTERRSSHATRFTFQDSLQQVIEQPIEGSIQLLVIHVVLAAGNLRLDLGDLVRPDVVLLEGRQEVAHARELDAVGDAHLLG